jgi:hypothetical protein
MIRVVIIGTGFPDWAQALFAGAPVWARLDQVREVVQLPSVGHWAGLPADSLGDRTLVIPLMEQDVLACIRHPQIKSLALLPTEQALLTLRDKAKFAHYVLTQGLGEFQPVLYRHTHALKFPVAIKRTDLHAGNGIARADSLVQFLDLLGKRPFAGETVLATEWIEGGQEYVTHAVVVRGRIRWHQSFEYRLEPGQVLRRGSAGRHVRPIIVPNDVLRVFEALLSPLDYSGICNIDFKLTPERRLKIFEVNPRLGGSLLRREYLGFLTQAFQALLDPDLYPPPA